MTFLRAELPLDSNRLLNNVSEIILASSSKRRLDLLKLIGIKPDKIIKPEIDELIEISHLKCKSKDLAYKKAKFVQKHYKIENKYIIAADTMVCRSGLVYEKAKDAKEVLEYLKKLSGKKHYVYGSICIISPNNKVLKRLVITEVFFKRLCNNDFNNNELLVEGIGKAGGYAIQGKGSLLVKKIKGSFYNVVGLSIFELNNMLLGLGWKKN
ncbi:MAG: septum formation protein Maf [Rickettsiales bacterium]|nr:septum formation protein Maf [Rickettsiales bacterium]